MNQEIQNVLTSWKRLPKEQQRAALVFLIWLWGDSDKLTISNKEKGENNVQ